MSRGLIRNVVTLGGRFFRVAQALPAM